MMIYLKRKRQNFVKMVIVVRSVFQDENKYYPRVFFQMDVFMNYPRFILKELTFMKVLVLIRQVHQHSAPFVTTITFQIKNLLMMSQPLAILLFQIFTVLTVVVLLMELQPVTKYIETTTYCKSFPLLHPPPPSFDQC